MKCGRRGNCRKGTIKAAYWRRCKGDEVSMGTLHCTFSFSFDWGFVNGKLSPLLVVKIMFQILHRMTLHNIGMQQSSRDGGFPREEASEEISRQLLPIDHFACEQLKRRFGTPSYPILTLPLFLLTWEVFLIPETWDTFSSVADTAGGWGGLKSPPLNFGENITKILKRQKVTRNKLLNMKMNITFQKFLGSLRLPLSHILRFHFDHEDGYPSTHSPVVCGFRKESLGLGSWSTSTIGFLRVKPHEFIQIPGLSLADQLFLEVEEENFTPGSLSAISVKNFGYSLRIATRKRGNRGKRPSEVRVLPRSFPSFSSEDCSSWKQPRVRRVMGPPTRCSPDANRFCLHSLYELPDRRRRRSQRRGIYRRSNRAASSGRPWLCRGPGRAVASDDDSPRRHGASDLPKSSGESIQIRESTNIMFLSPFFPRFMTQSPTKIAKGYTAFFFSYNPFFLCFRSFLILVWTCRDDDPKIHKKKNSWKEILDSKIILYNGKKSFIQTWFRASTRLF